MTRLFSVLTAVLLLIPSLALGAPASIPHTFQAGTPAVAAEVNENFQALLDAVNSADTSLSHILGPEAKRFVVSKAPGDFQTIQAAIDAVPAGESFLIDIFPGTYVENLVLKPNIHLRGAGRLITTVQAADPAQPVITINNVAAVAITGLTVTGGTPGLRIVDASPDLYQLTVTANVNAGIDNLRSSPLVKQSSITENTGEGILNNQNSSPRLIDDIISGNTLNGIHNILNSSPTVFDCTITANLVNGIHNETSDPQLYNDRITDNIEDGLRNDESSPTVLSSRISDNGSNGILNTNLSIPTLVGNRIADNDKNGIYNINQSSPHVIGNRITGNLAGDGIRNEQLSSPTVVGNRITDNVGNGVFSQNGSDASLTGNRISNNTLDGVHIDNAVVNVNANRITANADNGVQIINAPGPSFILHNRLDNAGTDVVVATAGGAHISFNVYDEIQGAGNAVGAFNLTTGALIIAPNTPAVGGTTGGTVIP